MGRLRGVGVAEGGLDSTVHGMVDKGLAEVGKHGLGLTDLDKATDTGLAAEEQCRNGGKGSGPEMNPWFRM